MPPENVSFSRPPARQRSIVVEAKLLIIEPGIVRDI